LSAKTEFGKFFQASAKKRQERRQIIRISGWHESCGIPVMKTLPQNPVISQTVVTSLSVDDCLGDFGHTCIFTTMSIEYQHAPVQSAPKVVLETVRPKV
jgi:hypothetical protein